MKKSVLFSFIIALIIPLTGCNLTPSQSKVVAQNAGLGASITWVAYDNPSPEEMALVKGVLGIIGNVATDTSEGATYTQVLYPVVEDHVSAAVENGDIKANEKPLVLAGSLAVLNGIDLLFATNPEWDDNHDLSREIVASFLLGAESGLALADNDPRMVNARQNHTARARAFKQ